MNEQPISHGTQRQQGAALVEFAVIFPMLVILLFGSAEAGRVLYQQNMLTKAVMAGTRFIARSPNALTVGCGQGTDWGAVTAKAATLIAFAPDAPEPRLEGLDAAGAIVFTPYAELLNGQPVCVIRTQASTPFAGLFGAQLIPLMDIGTVELNALEEERYIGD